MKPMLAEKIETSQLDQFLSNENWWMEQKFDGHRVIVEVQNGRVTPINKQGNAMVDTLKRPLLPIPVLRDFSTDLFDNTWLFDGELLNDSFVVFDLIMVQNSDLKDKPFSTRHNLLNRLAQHWPREAVQIAATAKSYEEKLQLATKVDKAKGEGVMLKHTGGRYQYGERSIYVLKCKYVKTADVVVTTVGRLGKNSVAISVYDDLGNLEDVGACTVQPKMLGLLRVGDVIEVRYLYATDENKLFQPAFIRKRDDKSAGECTLDQLEYTDKSVLSL